MTVDTEHASARQQPCMQDMRADNSQLANSQLADDVVTSSSPWCSVRPIRRGKLQSGFTQHFSGFVLYLHLLIDIMSADQQTAILLGDKVLAKAMTSDLEKVEGK